MIKWIESTGKTEEAAIAAALEKLHLERDDVSVELIARAKSGFLGIGSTPAKVRVSYEVPDEEEPIAAPAPAAKPVPAPAAAETPKKREAEKKKPARQKAAPAKASVPAEKPKAAAPAAPAAAEAQTTAETAEPGSYEEKIITFLTGLLQQMGSAAVPQVKLDENGNYQVELVGKNLGALIGRRGETLDAIQQLTNYAVNHGQSKRVRIHLDAENYRAKREESLQRLARKTAGKAIKNRRNVTLEPMNAYERHVIHTALQDYRDVTTYSIGTEPNRRVVISYSREG